MGYASDAQRKAVHANKADGGKGHPDNKKSPAKMHCTGKKKSPAKNKIEGKSHSELKAAGGKAYDIHMRDHNKGTFVDGPLNKNKRRQQNREDVKKAKEGKKGKERRQAARAERQKQRDEGRRGVGRTVEKVKETVEKVRDSRVGRAVEGAVNTAKAVKKGDVKGVVEGVKKTASAFSMVDPITGMPAQTQMSNMPPQPSNTMGNARPVFDARTQNIATGIYGGMQARQNAAGATPVYPGEMPVQSPFQNGHEKKLVGENTDKVQKDKKGNEFALVSENSKNFRKGDTIRPMNKMNFNKKILKDGFIMGGDYITRNNRIINK